MRKLIYISILLTFGFTSVFGQGLYRLGAGTEFNEVGLVTPLNNGLFVFEITNSAEYKLHQFDGFTYSDLGLIPNIPNHGDSNKENFKIVDARQFDGKLYVLGHDFGPQKSTSPTRILTWDGSKWSDITTTKVREAYSATKLIEFKGNLCILGIFKTDGILYLDNENWIGLGSRLGTNTSEDYVLDAETYLGRIYATGEFTRPLLGQRYNTAVFENNEWRPMVTPPFIGKSKQFTIIKGELILTGEANVEYDYIKAFDGIGWTNISVGLDDVFVTEFWDVAGTEDILCLTGIFENKQTGAIFNYLTKDADGWHFGEQQFTTDKIHLCENGGQVYAYGEFDYPGVQAIGEIGYHSAIVSGKVYFDENDNCIQDVNEPGLSLAKVILNPGNLVTFADENGLYEFPVSPGSYTITFEPGLKNEYGCGRLVSLSVGANVNYEVPGLNAVERPNVVDLELSSQLSNGWKLIKGQYNELQLNAFNNGSVTINGATLQLKMGDWWDNVTITPTPSSVSNDEYVWNISELEKGETFTIRISGKIKAELSEFNDFCFTGEVSLPQKDVSTKSNREAAQLTTVDEIDPITKQVDCGAWYSSVTDKISYQIRFENEANEIINNVTVLDTFDSELITTYVWDYTDIGPSTQHDVKMIKVPGKEEWRLVFTWMSTDAKLAPAGDANGRDVGYATVKFRLHDLSKEKGVELCNRAQVKFGNNEPLYTNTVCSKATSLNIPGIPVPSQLQFYPNPADQFLALSNESSDERTIDILNQLGQVVKTFTILPFEETEIDISAISSGVYMVNILGFETQKLVIQ
ncbi:MAG: hypothetical protein ACI8SE_001500 [Bacteroidia bacterium]